MEMMLPVSKAALGDLRDNEARTFDQLNDRLPLTGVEAMPI